MSLTLILTCKEHPRYQGIRRPTCTCFDCDQIYNIRQSTKESPSVYVLPPKKAKPRMVIPY